MKCMRLLALALVVHVPAAQSQEVVLDFDGTPAPGRTFVKAAGEPPTFTPGRRGQAISFGEGAVVAVPFDLDPRRHPQITASLWVRISSDAAGQPWLMSPGAGTNLPAIRLRNRRVGVEGHRADGTGNLGSESRIALDQWTHVAVVWNYAARRIRLYVGDESRTFEDLRIDVAAGQVARQPLYLPPGAPADTQKSPFVFVGARNFSTYNYPARGIAIDDLHIIARELNAAEIAALRSVESAGAVASASASFPTSAPAIAGAAIPGSPTREILAARQRALSRAQLVLNPDGAIAYLSIGAHVTAPWGNRYLSQQLAQWAGAGERITEIAGVPGLLPAVGVAEFAHFAVAPASALGLLVRRLTRAAGDGETIDLVALPPGAEDGSKYLLIAGGKVYSRGVPAAVVTIAQNALAAGEEVSAILLAGSNGYAVATSGGIHTADLPAQSTLAGELARLHAQGERIEDIVIHPQGFGWLGETGSYAIVTDRRILGVHVNCDSFDQARDWVQAQGLDRTVTCDGPRRQVAAEIPPQDIPDLELKDGQCEWGARGTLSVHHKLDLLAQTAGQSALAGVLIRVSGSTPALNGWGAWNAWPAARTDAYGRFAIRVAKNCGERRLKVEIRFQDAELEVRHRNATGSVTKVKWYELGEYHSSGGGLIAVEDFAIGQPPGTAGILAGDAAEMWPHADIWVLYKNVIALMKAHGSLFAFRKQVKIKYPHDGLAPDAAETSYANPENGVIYITSQGSFDNFTGNTLLHELGHIWSYQHSGDSYNLAVPVLGVPRLSCLTLGFLRGVKFQTHGLVADRCVAFYEGFAEFFKDNVALALFGASQQVCGHDCPRIRPLPFSREYLGFGPWTSDPPQPVSNLERLERHDMGWYSALHALTDASRAVHAYGPPYSSGTPSHWFVANDSSHACRNRLGPDIDFWDVLRSFSPGGGYPWFRPIRRADELAVPQLAPYNDTRFDNFLDRLAATTGKMTSADVAALRRLIDPGDSVEPWQLFCP
jgi:Concanavalin A-like lectin/glucanases superfamily